MMSMFLNIKLFKIFHPCWSCFPHHIPQIWDHTDQSRLCLLNPRSVRIRPVNLLIDSGLIQWDAGRLPSPLLRFPSSSVSDCCSPTPLARLQSLRGAKVLLDRSPRHGRRQQNNACLTRGTFSKVSVISRGGGGKERAAWEKLIRNRRGTGAVEGELTPLLA